MAPDGDGYESFVVDGIFDIDDEIFVANVFLVLVGCVEDEEIVDENVVDASVSERVEEVFLLEPCGTCTDESVLLVVARTMVGVIQATVSSALRKTKEKRPPVAAVDR